MITFQGSKFTINCQANVISTPLIFSATNIQFEATPLGEISNFTLDVINTKSFPVDIEFDVPNDFYFDPIVSTLQPGIHTPIFISFKPSIPYKNLEEKQESELSTAKGTAKKEKRNSKSIPKEKIKTPLNEVPPPSRTNIINNDFIYKIYDYNISCFWKNQSNIGRNHLLIKAASILPTLFITKVVIQNNSRGSEEYIDLALKKIDFGVVALGQYKDALITIKNMTKKSIPLIYENDCGSFEILTPNCEISSLQSKTIRIRFSPTSKLSFNNNIRIRSSIKHNIRITLNVSGQGAAPSIAVSLESIDFGNVLIGHSVTKTIQIKNNATFGMKYIYKLVPSNEMHHKNLNQTESFIVEKESEWLDADCNGLATIKFSPDHDERDFQSLLIISAGEDGLTKEIPINGCSWPFLMFILGGTEEIRLKTAFDHSLLDEPYFRSCVLCDMSWPGSGSQVTLIIGVSQQNEDIKKSNGEFFIEPFNVSGFTINPMKGLVDAGGLSKIIIEYSPPASSLFQVGQWIILDSFINLKCGEFNKKVPLKLKCLINIQQNGDLSIQSRREGTKTSKKKNRTQK